MAEKKPNRSGPRPLLRRSLTAVCSAQVRRARRAGETFPTTIHRDRTQYARIRPHQTDASRRSSTSLDCSCSCTGQGTVVNSSINSINSLPSFLGKCLHIADNPVDFMQLTLLYTPTRRDTKLWPAIVPQLAGIALHTQHYANNPRASLALPSHLSSKHDAALRWKGKQSQHSQQGRAALGNHFSSQRWFYIVR